MSARPNSTQLLLEDKLSTEPSSEETPHIDPADVDQFTDVPTLGHRTWLTFATFLVAVGIGVAATLAWQAYSGAAREAIAPAAVLNAISVDISALRHNVDRIANDIAASQEQVARSVDQLAAQVITGREEITHGITELRTVEQQILDLSTRPAPGTVAKSILRPSQAPTAVTPARNP